MSLSLMVRVMEEVDVTRPKQAVLLAMAEHAHDDGSKCFPSVDRIAWKANYKPRAVTDVIRELKQDEVLEEVQTAKAGRPAEYHIHLDKAKQKPSFEEWREQHGRHAKSEGGAKNAPVQSHERGVQSHEKNTRENAPEPLGEPSEEPSVSTEGTQSVSSAENRKPQQLLADQLYQRLNETYNIQLKPKQYSFHLGSFKRILEKKNATPEERERVIAHMVAVWPKAPKIEAETALQDVRLGRDDGSAYRQQAESSTSNGYSERKPASKPESVSDEEAGIEPTSESERMTDEEYERQMAELGL